MPGSYHRRSIRLRDYDYSRDGAYFITICTYRRECLFGDVIDGEMIPNTIGCIVEEEWLRSPMVRSYVRLDSFVVMPNHMHGIIILTGDNVGATRPVAPTTHTSPSHRPKGPTPHSIGAIMAQFKSICTRRINRIRRTPGAPLWQRNYYEHIIRDEAALNHIRHYTQANPARWSEDRDYPANLAPPGS